MLVRGLQTRDLPALLQVFLDFPHKAGQQRFQKIDTEKISRRFLAAEEKRLAALAPERPMQWAGFDNNKLCSFSALLPDAWHSQIYGGNFGKIAPFLTHGIGHAARLDLLDAVLAAARREGIRHLSVRVDGSEYDALHALVARGFRLVDCSVKMAGWLRNLPALAPVADSGLVLRRYQTADLPVLQAIAARAHPYNHYYNDPLLPRRDTVRLFEAWVAKCCGGLASDVFVLEADGEPRGFVLYLNPAGFNREMGTRIAILDFVCLDTPVRGGGMGRRMIAETLRILGERFDMVELRTSQNNYPAQACYADLGMRTVSTDFALHWHAE